MWRSNILTLRCAVFIFMIITRENIFCVQLRQAYLSSTAYQNRIASRTVIIENVPKELRSETIIKCFFGEKKIKNVCFAWNTSELELKLLKRKKLAMKLEKAEVKLIKSLNRSHNSRNVRGNPQFLMKSVLSYDPRLARWAPSKDRPTHRLGFFAWRKVDTINWARYQIWSLNSEITKLQDKHMIKDAPPLHVAFVEFHRQSDAQIAYLTRELFLVNPGPYLTCLTALHHRPLCMAPCHFNLEPSQIIWSNITLTWWQRALRYRAANFCVCVLIIFWAVPVSVVGSFSNLDTLTSDMQIFRFVNDIPAWIRGTITSFLPTLALSILMSLVPRLLRCR